MSTAAIHNLSEAAGSAAGAQGNQPAARPPQPAAQRETDTVQLTVAQRVFQLHNQGQQVPQIASTLNLPVAEVNNYLNVSNKAG
jgi:hypothetical protein